MLRHHGGRLWGSQLSRITASLRMVVVTPREADTAVRRAALAMC
jgi:hypothetical protein